LNEGESTYENIKSLFENYSKTKKWSKDEDIVQPDPDNTYYPHRLSRSHPRSRRSKLPAAMLPCRPLAPPPPPPRALTFARVPPSSLRPPPSSLRVVRCMAKERRVRMVAKQIQRELADMLTRDPVLQRAVLPEAALGADRYLSSLTTIADVELSNDLQVRSPAAPAPR